MIVNFWCITLLVIVVRMWWKHQHFDFGKKKPVQAIEPMVTSTELPKARMQLLAEQKKMAEAKRQRERDIADLRRQGYTDELITSILPVIEGDK